MTRTMTAMTILYRFAAVLLLGALLAPAARAATFPSDSRVFFETGGCRQTAASADWYTTFQSSSTARYSEFFLEVTESMAPATVEILDAESRAGGPGDPVDEENGTADRTRFELRSGDGTTLLAGTTVPSGSPNGTTITWTGLNVGLYRIRSYVGTDQIPGENTGAYCDQAATENDDDNSFRIRVNGSSAIDGLLGFLQVTYEQQVGTIDYQMYFLVGPALSDTTLQLRNFDLDGGATSTTYNKPPNASGAAVTGTVSGNGLWNGPGATVNTGQDNVVADNDIASGANDAGAWGYRINNWTTTNQTIFEANNTGVRLALTDTAPTRAGFFTITPSGTQATTIGVPVDHPFSVTNSFFTEDVINFSLFGTNPYYSVALRSDPNCDQDAADSAALTDIDLDGNLDTGLLGASGTANATRCFFLRVTPNAGASVSDTTRINAVSLMDSKVGGSNTIRFVDKTTLLPAVINKAFDPNPMAVNGISRLTFTISNPNSIAVTGLVFGDTYPAGLVNAATPNVTNTCGGVITGGVGGGNSIGLNGGTVAGGATCTVAIDVTSTSIGTYVNTSSSLASTNAGTGGTANATLVVLNTAPPSIAKSFSPNPVITGGTATLTLTLSNSNPVALNGVAFSDVFPPGLVVASPTGAGNTCGGTLTDSGLGALAAGDGGIALAAGTIAPNSTCAVTVNVTAASAASYLNTTSAVTSTNGGTGNVASDTLVVHDRPSIAKSFSRATMNTGDVATLTVTLTNPNSTAMTGASFTDTYPTNLFNAFVPNASGTCGGTVTAASGGGSLALSGGVIPANGSCVVTVDVTSTTAGTYNNTIGAGDLTTDGGISNNTPANASITVQAISAPVITKAFNTSTIQTNGTAQMTIVVSNPNVSATLTGVAFNDTYPAGLVNRNPSAVAMTCTTGSTGTRTGGANGGNTLGFLNGTILAGGSCTLTVNVTSAANGTYNNSTGVVSSANGGNGAAANASLTVQAGLVPPVISKVFTPSSLGAGSPSTLTFTISNPNNAQIFNLGFLDTYPAGLVNAATPNVSSNCDGVAGGAAGTVGGVAGGNTIGLAGPAGPSANDALAANASCTVSVNVTSATANTYNYASGTVQACTTNAAAACPTVLTGNTATASVSFFRPTITKSITPGSIISGGKTTLTLVLANDSAVDMTGATFIDTFPVTPGAMTVASPLNFTNSCGGTLNDNSNNLLGAGDAGIRLNNGTIPANGTCFISIDVTASTGGTYTNSIAAGGLTTTNGGSNAAGTSANLFVPNRPAVAKSFSPSGIRTFDTSTLTITLSNNNAIAATGVTFTDNLPAGVTVTGAPSTDCAGGIVSSTSTSVSLVGGTIPAGAPGTCTVTVNVTADVGGSYTNTIAADSVSGTTGTNAAPASAVLNVLSWPTITKSFSIPTITPNATSVLTIVVGNNNPAIALADVTFNDVYPSGLLNRSSGPAANATLNCTGGSTATLTGGANGGNSIGITGGTLQPASTCTITVNVTAAALGSYPNDTGIVTSSTAGGGNSASATLTVGNTQPTLAKAFSPTTVAVDSDSVLTLTLGNGNAGPLGGVAFTDTYPSGLVNSPTPSAASTCGGTVTATPGGGSLSLVDGLVPAGGTCTVTVNVRSTVVGSYANTVPAGGLTAAGGFASTVPGSATLEVKANAPIVNKSFSVSPIPVNGTSVLSIVASNPNTLTTLTGVAVGDTYPAGLVNRTPANAAITCTPGSSATLTGGADGGNTLGISGGAILPGGTCTASVEVTSASTGTYLNSTGTITASNAFDGGTASDTLVVDAQPTLAKSFTPATVAIGADSVLTVTLTNTNANPVTAVDLTDTYPGGLVNSPSPSAATTCGGTVTAAPGGNTLQLSGGTIPAAGSCTVTVNVRSNSAGAYDNTLPAGALTAAYGYTNTAPASATLTVQVLPPTISKAFVTPISTGDISRLTFTVTNPNPSTALSGIALTDVFPVAPAAMTVANPLATGNTCGGTLQDSGGGVLANGDVGIRITGAALAAGASCTFYVDVTAPNNGTYTNTTQAITATESGAGGTATAQMVMQAGTVAPTVSKTFQHSSLGMHGITRLTLTFFNPNNATVLQRLQITDDYLGTGLVNAPTPNVVNTCGGTSTAAAGGTVLALTGNGNSIPANGSCSISVDVTSSTTSPPTSGIAVTNNSGAPSACVAVGGGGGRCGNPAGGNAAATRTGNAVTAPITFHRPTIAKAVSPASIGANGTATVTLTLANPSGVAMPNATITDAFPAGMTVASPLVQSNTCGGSLLDSGGGALAAGDVGVRLTGGTIPAGGTCAIAVNVTAATAGTYNNTIAAGDLTASGNTTTNGTAASNAAGTNAVLTVRNRPAIAKSFSPASIGTGNSSTLTFTLTNNNATAATGISFTDTYPAGLVNATGVVGGTCTGVTTTATAGGGTFNVTGGTIPGGAPGSCTITVDVTGPVGTYNNTASGVTTNETPDGPGAGSNTAALDIRNRPTIAKAFSPAVITPGGTSTVTFTLSNDNPTAATGIAFTDTYPAGLVNTTPLVTGGTCTGVTTSATAGGSTFNVMAGSIPGGAPGTCTITVQVTAASGGAYDNTTSGVTSTQSGATPGPGSNTATLTVGVPVTVVKSSAVISDPYNGNTSPKRIPGAIIEYTVTVSNTASAVAVTNVVISDTPPANTAYVPGTLEAGGTAEDDDASGADETDPNGGDFGQTVPGGVTLRIGTIPAGASDTGKFRVELQ